jgi:hypothetical protein
MYIHPQYVEYPKLAVYEGIYGEVPSEGAFYSAIPGQTLDWLAENAYDDVTLWTIINESEWNRAHCVYRTQKDSCTASITVSGGFLSICNHYPMIWIPRKDDIYEPGQKVENSPGLPILSTNGIRTHYEPALEVPDRAVSDVVVEDDAENGAVEEPADVGRTVLWVVLGVAVFGSLIYVARR